MVDKCSYDRSYIAEQSNTQTKSYLQLHQVFFCLSSQHPHDIHLIVHERQHPENYLKMSLQFEDCIQSESKKGERGRTHSPARAENRNWLPNKFLKRVLEASKQCIENW